MEEVYHRLQLSAAHLRAIDHIFANLDPLYHEMRDRLINLDAYSDIARQLYGGQEGRQMILSDLLVYILAGRGYWAATESEESFEDYIRAIMYIVNMLLIQESILSANVDERRHFLEALQQENIEHFFVGEEEMTYQELIDYDGMITVREPRELYKMMDSLLPKSIGTVNELITYIHLIIRQLGYAVPLLFIQRIFRGRTNLPPPDFLLLKENSLFGIEVGTGIGRYSLTRGKIEQINSFTQDTGIPVLTATVPHLYRCADCNEWILFCDEVIERTAQGDVSEVLSCEDCNEFSDGNCQYIIYYGQIEPNTDRYRYHYQHFIQNPYVQETSLSTPRQRRNKLIHYYPYVHGLERLRSYTM